MTDSTDVSTLDGPPDAAQIADLRDRAADEDASIEVHFPAADGGTKRFVVSARGTCVILSDLREDSFNPSVTASDIADALRE